MAEVQENSSPPGIKLFGATISLKDRSETNADGEGLKKDDDMEDKRPDKIIPCPRCKSTETKFCYFNNYNVNQPRHFCKGCQRFWTAGGALRNVPVGAGHRKTKPPCLGLPPLSEDYPFDPSGLMQQLDFDAAVEEWQLEEHGGFRHPFPGKRRRCASNGQTR